MMDKPKRRYELSLAVEADDLNNLIGVLNHIQFELSSQPEDTPRNIVSGGYGSSFILDLAVNQAVTHDTWEVALSDYLKEKKEVR